MDKLIRFSRSLQEVRKFVDSYDKQLEDALKNSNPILLERKVEGNNYEMQMLLSWKESIGFSWDIAFPETVL